MFEHPTSGTSSNTFLRLRQYRHGDAEISVFLRELEGAYEVSVARDLETAAVFNRYSDIDDVTKFLTRTHEQYVDDGWTEVATA